jgi:predicted acylesterase/phospholipase RssA
MIPSAAAAAVQPPWVSVRCWDAVHQRLGETYEGLVRDGGQDGPGLPEICARCTLNRTAGEDDPASARRLLIRPGRPVWPEWPRQGETTAPVPSPPSQAPPPIELTGWPVERAALPGRDRPLVSFLFGGGVFRGVFHMGVLNGLNELGLMPDLVAGSSVGSIIAAMIAQVFTEPREARQIPIANLSATFLGIDQLVMTDRLADFVRGLTLRAADANFSARDLDLVLRRYDLDPGMRFGARGRRVIAGLERLFYLSPLHLSELVKAAREQDAGELKRLLQTALQEFFDRGGVGQEILGAEPLALLIREEVIRGLHREPGNALFSAFAEHGIQFLATATNLNRGELEILGGPDTQGQASLLYGLLASSAFPAVFRPRQKWEMLRHATETDQYVDGGIIDNLPLDAVARFLDQASRGERPSVARRPRVGGREVPHLLFTASLEVDKTCLDDGKAETFSKSFLRLQKRAKTFGYNRKIDAYGALQRDLREIYRSQIGAGGNPAWTPLDLHVIAVRPRWLCNTFGFHPMLGFRRRKQAQSIAHGCASTIATFHQARQNGKEEWLEAWGVRGLDRVEAKTVTSRRADDEMEMETEMKLELNPRRAGKAPGQCWFRDAPCPFSKESLSGIADLGQRKFLIAELAKVHEECGKVETHRSVSDLARPEAKPAT